MGQISRVLAIAGLQELIFAHKYMTIMKFKKNLILAFTFALLISFVGAGCDSNDSDSDIDFLGDWQQVENDPDADLFIRLTEREVIIAGTSPVLGDLAVCTVLAVDDIDAENGRITGADSDGDPFISTVTRNGDQLVVDGDTYERTNDFPTCATTI